MLPRDLLHLLASYLEFPDSLALSSTCKRLRATLTAPEALQTRVRAMLVNGETLPMPESSKALIHAARLIKQRAARAYVCGTGSVFSIRVLS